MVTKRKLAMAIIPIFAVFCGVFGISACNDAEHVHTFSEEWTKSTTEHWHEATCDHTDERGSVGQHVDADNNGKCDVCDYAMPTEGGTHTHTFDESHWEHDANTHWHAATCEHPNEKGDEAPHVDVDGNQFCDVCGEYVAHVHKFNEEEWAFTESEHWHPATCTHEDEKGSPAAHNFADGVCECGVKESEVEVYNTLTALEETDEAYTDETFVQWRDKLKDDGVTDVRKTAKGDIVYDRSGDIEAYIVADRTIKVKAQTEDGDGIAHVWFKVAMSEDGDFHLVGPGTDALAVGETGADGIAELTFTPIGGFSNGEKIKYEILLAQAQDIVALEGGDETKIQVYPYRYKIKGIATGLGDVGEVTVSIDDTNSDNISGQLEFIYDASWKASEKLMLPYERRYDNEVDGTDENGEDKPTEHEKVYTFTATGNNIFDYMYFSPAHKYSWEQGEDVEDFDKITANFRKSASGVYEISFTVTGDGSASLYYWTGNLDLQVKQKPDGTPTDDCVVSASGTKPAGSGIADEAFTGENKITVTIKPDNGLEAFQLGMICQDPCQVTLTVERKSDYVDPSADYKLTLGMNDNGGEGYALPGYGQISFALVDIPADLYYIKVSGIQGTSQTDVFRCWTSVTSQSLLWCTGKCEGIIRITNAAKVLYMSNGVQTSQPNLKIEISKYEIPKLTAGGQVNLPFTYNCDATDKEYNDNIEIAVDNTVEKSYYLVDIPVSGSLANGRMWIVINGTETEIFGGSATTGGTDFLTVVELKGGDVVKFKSKISGYVWSVLPVKISKTDPLKDETNYFDVNLGTAVHGVEQLVAFIAPKAGTYTLTVFDRGLTEGCQGQAGRQGTLNRLTVTNNKKGNLQKTIIERVYTDLHLEPERKGEFTLSEGELIILRFNPNGGNSYSPYQCTIKYKSV